MPRSGMGPDMVVGSEPWHRALPSDWVPLIARDVAAQASGAATTEDNQSPFSNAYLTTQPAKRRKLASAGKPEGPVERVIAEALSDAIEEAGVAPAAGRQAVDSVADQVARNPALQEAVREESEAAMARRASKDEDFNARKDRFPRTRQFVKKRGEEEK